MTNEELLEDIRQLVTTTVSQSETRLTARLDKLAGEVQDGFAGVGEAIADINDRLDKRDAEVEQRLIRLEHQAV